MSFGHRPNLSITLPKDFTFHYNEDDEPKTPTREPVPIRAPSPHAYRIRRRAQPTVVSSEIAREVEDAMSSSDIPIPTIESPIRPSPRPSPNRAPLTPAITDSAPGYLAPVSNGRFSTMPRTPSPKLAFFGGDWSASRALGLGISTDRPSSASSLASNSSEESDGGSARWSSLEGSCASPDSDAADPFYYPVNGNAKSVLQSPFLELSPTVVQTTALQRNPVFWTAEMDKHIWTAYMSYLQDPTVTPFKMLPGSPPPLGVCHRVVRAVRRTWPSAQSLSEKSSGKESDSKLSSNRYSTPDTIVERDGSLTPKAKSQVVQKWPKSGSSTRRRLRELCKRKATISPHYQRLLQSRSPSPFSSSSRTSTRERMRSPTLDRTPRSAFATRDIQMSLVTSTSSTMQPDGDLAQLTRPTPAAQDSDEWFNDASIPWASPAPIPSSENDNDANARAAASDIPRLGSPFGHHTWGPGNSRPAVRPRTPRVQSDHSSVQPARLGSPVNLHSTFPYPNHHKRRAQHELDEELSPGGNTLRENALQDIFGSSQESLRRRVRARGFTLDGPTDSRLTTLFPASTLAQGPGLTASLGHMPTPSGPDALASPSEGDSIRRLASPFEGIMGRPSRNRGRHLPSTSLPSNDATSFPSIGQQLDPSNHHMNLD